MIIIGGENVNPTEIEDLLGNVDPFKGPRIMSEEEKNLKDHFFQPYLGQKTKTKRRRTLERHHTSIKTTVHKEERRRTNGRRRKGDISGQQERDTCHRHHHLKE